MTDQRPKIRVFVDAALGPGREVPLHDQAHYLGTVMRLSAGDEVALFNGRDGEWAGRLAEMRKRQGLAHCVRQTAPQRDPPDLWLCFAPIKKTRTDFIVEKAAELGAARIQPVFTQFTNSERLRVDRLQAHAVEAAEQCGGTFVPDVAPPLRFASLLNAWPTDRSLLFCDETLTAPSVQGALGAGQPGPWGILVGPEGGFAPEEIERLRAHPRCVPVTLGPRVLRADTAAVAALTAWQMHLGDWV
ncbi:MAG: 16S rRNA (uracil(1498)-N(3))-methyltransferase [Pseudomonadota bacterium]